MNKRKPLNLLWLNNALILCSLIACDYVWNLNFLTNAQRETVLEKDNEGMSWVDFAWPMLVMGPESRMKNSYMYMICSGNANQMYRTKEKRKWKVSKGVCERELRVGGVWFTITFSRRGKRGRLYAVKGPWGQVINLRVEITAWQFTALRAPNN